MVFLAFSTVDLSHICVSNGITPYQAQDDVFLTPPTRIAAISIGGSTIHSARGIGRAGRKKDFSEMWKKPNRMKWHHAKVSVIDEISMVIAEMVEYLEQTIRSIQTMKNDLLGEPFCGL